MRNSNRRGLIGIAVVALGVGIIGLNIRESVDPVILELAKSHGFHLMDAVGTAVVGAGVAFVWTRRSDEAAAE